MVYDVVVVGGGLIGLATTVELLRSHPGLHVANIEKEGSHGTHQSGHNSGVIHSGIYYRPGTLRARLCVEGRAALLRYCEERGIAYRLTGKLIVAVDEAELPRLRALYERGRANGVEGLQWLEAAAIAEHEPHCTGRAAIWSGGTGSIDFADVVRSFALEARARGADLFLSRKVTGIRRYGGVTTLDSPLGILRTRAIITCAGLQADALARKAGGSREPEIVPFRGDYLTLAPERADLVRGHIYPVPDPAFPFLGVHFTRRVDGSVWLGPNAVLAFAREGYRITDVSLTDLWHTVSSRGFRMLARRHWKTGLDELVRDVARSQFVAALRRYIPELRDGDCRPGPSGVRAQAIAPDGTLLDDLVLEAAEGAFHLRNAASPGATSCLGIARHLVGVAERAFELKAHIPKLHAALDRRRSFTHMETFVEVPWLLAHQNDSRVRIIDARSAPHGGHDSSAKSGGEQYAAGHIPGAVHLDYADHLADPATPHAVRAAPAERFAQMLSEHGIGDEHTIVAYDDGTVPYAARLVWMCRYYGHDDVHVLAGGLPAWRASGGATTADVPSFPQATFTTRTRPHLRASRDEVLSVALGQNDAQLLETQRDATYAQRDRDIPNAKRLSASFLLEDARGGRLAPAERIRAAVDALGLDRSKRTIVSCGSGVGASGAYLALLADGFSDVAVYDGSWMEWTHHGLPTVPKAEAVNASRA